jgi:hypothetical protein
MTASDEQDAGGATQEVAPSEDDAPRRGRRVELATVILLAVTALATAWSGYQASLWDGIQSSNYTQASGARTNAAQLRTAANQHRLADLGVFENHISAAIGGDRAVADFYLDRFTPALGPAYDSWIALDPFENPAAPPSPLAMPEYRLPEDTDAARLEDRADSLFAEGEDANTISDVYTLTTLLFAAVLFFTAISERFTHPPAQVVLLGLAGIGLVVGAAIGLGQPITTG